MCHFVVNPNNKIQNVTGGKFFNLGLISFKENLFNTPSFGKLGLLLKSNTLSMCNSGLTIVYGNCPEIFKKLSVVSLVPVAT